MHLFDIVVPCYYYGKYLPECVASILTQEGCSVRVLIIDDASSDDSAEIARSLAAHDRRIELIFHSKNIGHVATFNEGVAWASQTYFLLISADDVLAPGALKRAADLLDANPNVAFVYGQAIFSQGQASFPANSSSPVSSRVIPGPQFVATVCANPHNPVPALTSVVRTSVQKQVGLYKNELPHAGDLEMWLRLAMHGDVGEIGMVQGLWRKHDSNMSSFYAADGFIVRDYRQRYEAFRAFFSEHERALVNGKKLRKLANRGLAQKLVNETAVELERRRFWPVLRLSRLTCRVDPAVFAGKTCPLLAQSLWKEARAAWRPIGKAIKNRLSLALRARPD